MQPVQRRSTWRHTPTESMLSGCSSRWPRRAETRCAVWRCTLSAPLPGRRADGAGRLVQAPAPMLLQYSARRRLCAELQEVSAAAQPRAQQNEQTNVLADACVQSRRRARTKRYLACTHAYVRVHACTHKRTPCMHPRAHDCARCVATSPMGREPTRADVRAQLFASPPRGEARPSRSVPAAARRQRRSKPH